MQRFHFVFFVASIYYLAITAAPVAKVTQDHYDQRQNGTENYRVNIDGVLFAVAPAEALLTSSSDIEELLSLLEYDGELDTQFPTKSTTESTKKTTVDEVQENDNSSSSSSSVKPETEKRNSAKKVGFKRRFANFILPMLRRNRHE